ncbi:unnamed protein product [Cyprideis torosa]|uniref:Uncharacterized protein n=1 Tax=Cyprideis torosa TaxID=163714 RepID=A0A7R8ZWY0_9CRUS|nr:unnamed protein product [Cyprideis torosa]CAG0905765.1 unnamed protein product [Cyprideis torosa]
MCLCYFGRKRFTTSSDLRRHERRMHAMEKSSVYQQASHLQRHFRIHTGENPHVFTMSCVIHRSCSIASPLKEPQGRTSVPMRLGWGKCQLCPASFITTGALRVHLRTHTGERPLQCDLCGKRFAHSNSLRYHENKIHSETHIGR